MKKVLKITERGWGGHFIGAYNCRFRRNTLIEYGNEKVVVSTVGAYECPLKREITTIGIQRWYETMAFHAHKEGPYMEANVGRQVSIEGKDGIYAKKLDDLKDDVDNEANDMHENCVQEIVKRIQEKGGVDQQLTKEKK